MKAKKTLGRIFIAIAISCGVYDLIFLNIMFFSVDFIRENIVLGSFALSATVTGLIFLSIGAHLTDD